jgi:chromosome segregation ATPase
MTERSIAKKLTLLATEADSLEKALVQVRAERAREAELRSRAELDAEELRQQLRQARRRAKAAEHQLAELSASVGAIENAAGARESELREQLDQAEQAKKVLRHEVEQTERERRALELNYREVLANLRHAASEVRHSRPPAEEVTVVPSRDDIGW